jgi:hypothetical protein
MAHDSALPQHQRAILQQLSCKATRMHYTEQSRLKCCKLRINAHGHHILVAHQNGCILHQPEQVSSHTGNQHTPRASRPTECAVEKPMLHLLRLQTAAGRGTQDTLKGRGASSGGASWSDIR